MDVKPPVIERRVVDLKQLIKAINATFKTGEQYARKELESYKETGDLLLIARGQVDYGDWMAWVDKNISCSYSTANNCIRIAESWSRFSKCANLTEALRMPSEDAQLASKRPDTPEEEEQWDNEGGAPAETKPYDFPLREPGDESEDHPEEPVIADKEGKEVPPQASPAFEAVPRFKEWVKSLKRLYSEFVVLQDGPGGRMMPLDLIQTNFRYIQSDVENNWPTHVCPYCEGRQAEKPCGCCRGEGWTNKFKWQDGVEAARVGK